MSDRVRNVLSWVLTVLLFLWFGLAGVGKFLAFEPWIQRFANWGYPGWFLGVIAVLESAAALLVLPPRTAPYGALIGAMVMAGAVFTHVSTGIGSPVAPLIALALAATLAWLRWSRRWQPGA